jgi:hypothetical protein
VKVIQLVVGPSGLYALCEDGSVWQYHAGAGAGFWQQLPAIIKPGPPASYP